MRQGQMGMTLDVAKYEIAMDSDSDSESSMHFCVVKRKMHCYPQ
jgi:hypothetical protein